MRLLSSRRQLLVCPWVAFVIGVSAANTVRSASAAELGSPYRARVHVAEAAVRSGPGEMFYPTSRLAQGEVVEIFRQGASGWCAIRPPEGSFSWVFGRHLTLLEPASQDGKVVQLAEVDKADVPSRIGGEMTDEKSAVQIRLKKGEIVRVLGVTEVQDELFYKIAPPSGEFRWIHESSIHPVSLAENNRRETGAEEIAQTAATSADGGTPRSESSAAATTSTKDSTRAEQVVSGWRVSAEANRMLSNQNGDGAGRTSIAIPELTPPSVRPQTVSLQTMPLTSPLENRSTAVNSSAALPAAPSAASNPPASTIADLELRLSRMVADPPAAWNIDGLTMEAQTLRNNAQTVAERQAADATLAKIGRFAAIARQYRQTAGAGGSATYGVSGILRPVVTRRPGAPPFALVDERGQVLTFVTPTPNVNLHSFVGQRITVAGNRGYIPEFQREHVTAGRVTPIGERMVR